MEFRQLRYFVNAAKTLSFTEASKLSSVAQSTLSQQIRQLEIELGTPLFIRLGKHIQLTTEGKAFLNDAIHILEDVQQGLLRLNDICELKSGEIKVGIATGLVLPSLMADIVTQYNRSYPGIKINVYQVAGPIMAEQLREHDLDLALTFSPEEKEPDIDEHRLFATQLCVVVGEHHPLAKKTSIKLEELLLYSLVLPNKDIAVGQVIDKAMKEHEVEIHPSVEVSNLLYILFMLKTNHWVSILPDVATLSERGITRIKLEISPILMPASVIMLKNYYQRKAVIEFLRMLKERIHFLLNMKTERCDICGETFLV